MATVTKKKRKVDSVGRRFLDKWKLEYFSLKYETTVCLIFQETVAVFKEFNIKRHYLTKHANYDKLTGNERGEKLKQLEVVLTAQQCFFFTIARESNENVTKASYEVATLITKHCKPFTEGEFIKDCVMKIVKKICPKKKQEFSNVCLARNTVVRRIEDISSDIKRQLEAKGVECNFFFVSLQLKHGHI